MTTTPRPIIASRTSGKRVLLGILVLWLALLVIVYSVAAKLKAGGPEALRSRGPAPTTHAPTTSADPAPAANADR